MKKTLLFTLMLANYFLSNANTRMSAYRWRNDDGSEITATWKAAQNTAIQINNLDPIRIRVVLEDYSTGWGPGYYGSFYKQIQFSDNSGGTWKYLTDSGSPFSLISSSEVSNATPTTQQIATGNAASFIAGEFVSTESNGYINYPASTGKFTEMEFNMKANNLISNSVTYTFRVINTSGDLVTPQLTYSCGTAKPTATSPQNFNANAKVSDLAATGTDLKWYTSATGGTALDPATVLSTGLYYVSQTISCESERFEVSVNIKGSTLNFDGGYVELPINMPATYTKEAWIKVRDFSAVNNIISGGSDGEHAIYIPGGILSAGHNSGWSAVKDNAQLSLDTWYHVAVTYNSATNTMILYKNGIEIDQNTNVFPFIGSATRIGAFDAGQNLFNGAIEEARIWNKVLTQAEIQNNMNCELAGAQSGLVAYYKFNQGFEGADNSVVNTLSDSSGNGNNGTLIGFDLSADSSNWIGGSIIQTGNTCTTLAVGNHDLDFSSSLKVYPNPSSSAFFIDSDSNGTIVIFDLLGKTIKTQKIISGTNSLDLANVPNGTYLLKVTNEKNQSETVKLIKN
ncbi:LamG-like jellyroll fold domain-containing protein [Flavobacterium chungangense]|uniref:LamG-like jellyroll fold domain-containing protein n=1 Tax=Flavobacterium chungangense TaxID=554283 RepID=A0A6V6YYN5_9FLAO|nr:LamG-like jellyroll fold domain-containing protein [Flavobacterium chungangense]CAD0003792.1 hypothetical protein FLACHUCJ7_01606 [Flavobacterium chungangense]